MLMQIKRLTETKTCGSSRLILELVDPHLAPEFSPKHSLKPGNVIRVEVISHEEAYEIRDN